MELNKDELAFTDDLLEEMQKKEPVRPLLSPPDLSLVDIKESEIHQKRLLELQAYLVLAEDSQDVNETTAPKLLAQLSYGFRRAGEFCAVSQYNYKNAYRDRKHAEAVACLDNFRGYVSKRKEEGVDVKTTDQVRGHYINIDEGVMRAAERENYFEAIKEQLLTIKMEFAMAISTIKAIAYGHKDSNMISGHSIPVNPVE